MKQYPAYPAYKTTGCDWFPEIPSHWGIDRAKWSISSCQNGVWGAEPDGDDDLVCIRVADFDRQSLRVSKEKLTMRSIAEKDRRNRLLNNGDLLLEKSGGGEQQLVGAVVEFNQPFPAVTSNFIARMVASDGMSSRFLVYLHSHLYSGRVNFRSIKQTTGIQNLDSQAYLDEPISYPPLDEQQAIARFLDFKTAQIDALIAKKKVLLEKLAEKRTSLISHAVTKGLNPSVPMKDSGVAWLGDIPAHWNVKRLKFVGKTRYGLGEPPQKLDGGLPFIRATDIYRGEIDGSKVQTVDPDCVPWSRNPNLKAKDILVVRSGAYTGDSAIVPAKWEGSIAGYDMVYTTESALPEYIAFNLLSKHVLNGQIYLAKNRAAQPHLNAEELGDVVIALPPPDEQVEIVAYIEEETKRLAIQCDAVNSVVERLLEYRSSMITNAVTGKIDVRDVPIGQLPEA